MKSDAELNFSLARKGVFAMTVAAIAGCATVPPAPTKPPETPQPTAPAPAPPPPPAPVDMRLSWDDDANRVAWSHELIADIREHKTELDAGNPDQFVAGYSTLSPDAQVKYWAELVIAIAKYESTWNPHAHFKEPPPLHVTSIGLLQMSYEDEAQYHLEPLSRDKHSLEDPLVNLRCGVVILADLVKQDGVVAEGSGDHARGGARYWAVLRSGHGHKLADIKAWVKQHNGL